MNNDLISREALEKSMRKSINERYNSWTKTITVADIATLIFDEIDNAPTVDTTCPNCDSGYAQGYSDGYLKGKEERPIDDLSEYSDKLWKQAYERGKAERPQGEWIYRNNNWWCSECGETPKTMGYVGTAKFMHDEFKFCNHCGATMTGGVIIVSKDDEGGRE